MSQDDPQMKVRLPEDVKAFVEKAASEGARSQNSVIVDALRRLMATPMPQFHITRDTPINGDPLEARFAGAGAVPPSISTAEAKRVFDVMTGEYRTADEAARAAAETGAPRNSRRAADADALAHAKRVAIAADRPDWDDLVAEERQAERDRMLQGLRLQAGDLTPAHAAEILATLLMRDADYSDVFGIETRAAAATALVRVAQAAEKMAEAALVLEEAGL